MENIDHAKAARVWQRVKAQTPQQRPEQGIGEMIVGEWTDAATYLQLSRHFQGKDNAALRQMAEEEQAHNACLKGIYMLTTGMRPAVRAVPPPKEDPEQALRRCYGREMQCAARYEQRADDPEYGHIFAQLAQQERQHCRLILELLGSLKK